MAEKLQKLELTWIGKGNEPKLEPRILIEDPQKSYGDPNTENILIHGDNLLALKALEQDYTGKIKCIYIDPPYNTGTAFEHYDDGIEHSLWLNLMKPRLDALKTLLNERGTIWINIDDNEGHYLKVMCDEVFGRANFIANIVWQKRISPEARFRIGAAHDHILVYGKNEFLAKNSLNQLPASETRKNDFKNPDSDPKGPWASVDITGMAGHATPTQFYKVIAPNGTVHTAPKGRCWVFTEKNFEKLVSENKIWFGKDGNAKPRLKRYLFEVEGQNSWTWWTNSEVGHNQEAKKETLLIFGDSGVFETPKPERLIQRIIQIATNDGDIVLDSFLGSGTTAAVAQKMNRKWIGIELGEHINSHCIPRLKKVIDGEDKGGITEAIDWEGGGGFKFYTLAPSLLQIDKYGNEIINPVYNANMLAAAMAKQEGFRFAPDETVYWKQGKSSEKDFIFTTTQFITAEMLDRLHDEMQPEESLLVCCKSFNGECEKRYANITIKKIPQMLLGRCEYGKDDYSLNIISLPEEGAAKTEESIQRIETVETIVKKQAAKKKKKGDDGQPSLF